MTIEALLMEAKIYLAPQDVEEIVSAYNVVNQVHTDFVESTGLPYMQHSLAVAVLLAEMRIDMRGILAALLYDIVAHAGYPLDTVRRLVGDGTAAIIDCLIKFDALMTQPMQDQDIAQNISAPFTHLYPPHTLYRYYQNTDTVNKMLLSMAEEPCIVALKIADCLHKMRVISTLAPSQQERSVSEAQQIYVPLARRLGMGLICAELEELILRYQEPEKYEQLTRDLAQEMEKRRPFIDRVCNTLREEMARAGIRAEVYCSHKPFASIQRKLDDFPSQSNGRSALAQLQDIVFFGVLVDYDHDCYLALGYVHALWRPREGRIKDFIATPKLNGYQSLHTTVFVSEQQLAEIQVRTYDMERTANYGIANYWHLKEHLIPKHQRSIRAGTVGVNSNSVQVGDDSASKWRLSYREMRSWIELLREWQREQPWGAEELGMVHQNDIFSEQIFVFTPKGEVKYLPPGATILDIAYRIHTDLGDHCGGGRIITNVDDSERLATRLVPLDYRLKGGEIVDIVVNRAIHPTREWISFARTTLAHGKIRRYLRPARLAGHRQDNAAMIGNDTAHNGLDHAANEAMQFVTLASCCCPLPDDVIVGVLSSNNELLVHTRECRMSRSSYDIATDTPNVPIELDWQQIQPEYYLVPITLVARDRAGLLRDIDAVVADAGIIMMDVRTSAASSLQKNIITATLEIGATDALAEQLDDLLQRLSAVMSVISVERRRERNRTSDQEVSTYYWEAYMGVLRKHLLHQGFVDASVFPGVPVMYVDQILERYLQVHPEMNLEYQESSHALRLKNADVIQRMDNLLRRILLSIEEETVEAHIGTFERAVTRILQEFSSAVGFGTVNKQEYDGLVAFSLDTHVVFEHLRIPHMLPILFSFEKEMSDAGIELLRRLLLTGKLGSEAHVVVLLLFCDSQKLSLVKRRIAQAISRKYAYDIAIINHEDLLEIVSAREPERGLRRLILSQVSLAAVSPYKSQGPTPIHLFFGREHELREIAENAMTTSYVLIGGRRIGKTSILKRLERINLPVVGFRALYHDCSFTATQEELVQAVTSNKKWFPSAHWLSAVSAIFPSFTSVIQSLSDGQPLVILLDEADKLIATDKEIGYPLFNSLRALENTGLCTFILSGEQTLRAELTNPYSPLYNFASEMLVGRLDFPAVQELVTRPMEQLEIVLVDEAAIVQHIWNFTSGHPSVVQSLCQRLITQLNKRQARRLSVENVEEIVANYDFLRKDFLNVYWERATPLERLCSLVMVEDKDINTLVAIHAALRALLLEVTLNQVDEALERLVDLRNILRRTAEGYEFAVTALPLIIARTSRPHDLIALNSEIYRQHGDEEPRKKRGLM